ncbi:MAG TPA: phosphate ABC transporter permease subunit PstC [Thermoleophilaceae bacterium]|nr:phosphate ABC transporter permease subunit PstC [Thermoleophilaceae bacterium]
MEAASTAAAGDPRPNLTRGRTPRSVGENVIKALLFVAALISIATTVGIVVSLLAETLEFFSQVGVFEYLLGTRWSPLAGGDQKSFGVLPLISGTLYLTALGLVVAVPLGLGSAIYLAEYASPRARRIVKPVLELLAGIPTIVLGYFALTFITPVVLQGIFGIEVKIFNALSAGLALGVLILPVVATLADDSLRAVPSSLREGAFGLGASKPQVVLRVVFPAALSGIVAGLVLAASRAIGETVIVLVAGGANANLGIDPRESFQNMAAFIAQTARGDIAAQSVEFLTIFAVGTTLFVMTLLLNAISIRFVRRFQQVYE